MSEPMPEPQGGGSAAGGFMSRKFLGIPAIFWLLGAAILAYLYFRNRSSSSTAPAQSNAGSGQATTGDISFTPGTDKIDITAPSSTSQSSENETTTQNTSNTNGTPNPQPHHRGRPPTRQNQTSMKKYTVKKGQSLAAIAGQFGIDVACLAHNNTYIRGEVPGDKKVGQPLGTGAGLKTGQVLNIPTNAQCKAQGYKS